MNFTNKVRIPFIVILVFLLLSACSSDDDPPPVPPYLGIVNVEIVDANLIDAPRGNFQIYVDASLEDSANVPCVMTRPLSSSNLSCAAGSYDVATKIMSFPMTIDAVSGGTLDLNFTSTTNIQATLTTAAGASFSASGGARLVTSDLVTRNIFTRDLSKYTLFVLRNPVPGYDTGTLTGPGLVAPVVLWDGNYASVYTSYASSDTNDGLPQSNGAYVTYSTKVATTDTRLMAGTYTVTLSNPTSGTGTVSYSISHTNRDPESLYNTGARPPSRTSVTINSAPVVAGSSSDATPQTVGAGPYTFTWPNTIASPSTIEWQVVFNLRQADANVQHGQVRTTYFADGAGPVYTAANLNAEWSWALPNDIDFNSGEVVRVSIRASDSTREIRGNAASFAITK